jgi:hypothetical protein
MGASLDQVIATLTSSILKIAHGAFALFVMPFGYLQLSLPKQESKPFNHANATPIH